jgi:surface antigen
VVELPRGGSLQVVRQNLETTSAEALEAPGRKVNVAWRDAQASVISGQEEGQ